MADPDMFDDDDEGFDAFADAGAALGRQRPEIEDERPRGRPRGALNRKTRDFDRWYQAKGFRDPLAAMAQFLTADPVALQAWFAEHERTRVAIGKQTALAVPSLFDIIREMHACASTLAPYLHGKKPVQLELIDERLPHLLIALGTNQLEEGRTIAGRKALAIGPRPAELDDSEGDGDASKINDLEGDT